MKALTLSALFFWSLAILGSLCVICVQHALAAPIFPPLVSGQYAFKVRTAEVELDANGIPTTTPTRSVGIYEAADPDTLLLCESSAPGEATPVSVTVVVVGDRAELRARAYSAPGCTGQVSLGSDNGAYLFFTPPGVPVLEASDE